MKPKILLSARVPEACLAPYEDRYAFVMPESDRLFSYEEALGLLPECGSYLVINMVADKPVIDTAVEHGVKAIANFGVGYDNIDWAYATQRGLPVVNAPTAVTEATAELAASLIFSVMRGIPRYDRQLRQGIWHTPLFSNENTMIVGSTLGVVGFGRIGKRVCRKAQGMGMHVVYYDKFRAAPEVEEEFGVTYLPFDELLAESDCVTLHAPYFPENHHMFNAGAFARMKPTAYFVNTARGRLVDEEALCRALERGTIKGAALDVYEKEPNQIYPGLLALDNVVLTPHTGSLTVPCRMAICAEALSGLTAIMEGRVPPNVVNPAVLQNRSPED